jgi:rare lipoprotein A
MSAIRTHPLMRILLLGLLGAVLGSSPLWAVEEGLASWYGGKFQGRKTASGEVFDTNEFTAAHRTLPFGTRVRVTNLDTGRTTVVRINDRGPFVPGRIIDLSRAAAAAIGMAGSGVARVRVDVLPPGQGAPPPQRSYTIQLGAFRTRGYAEAMRRRAVTEGFPAKLQDGGEGLHRVVLLQVAEGDLEETRRKLAAAGWTHVLARLDR